MNATKSPRVLGIADLRALMVQETRGARTFWISKESRSRVHVSYHNDNVFTPVLATVIFPCYPSVTGETRVVLEPMRYISDYATTDAVPLMFAPLLEGTP